MEIIPSFRTLYFNPTQVIKQVTVNLPSGTFGVYDAITETILFSVGLRFHSGNSAGRGSKADQALFSGNWNLKPSMAGLYAGDDILDYHYQYDLF